MSKREIQKIAREIRQIKAQLKTGTWATSEKASKDFVKKGYDSLPKILKNISTFYPSTREGSGEAAFNIGPVDTFGYIYRAEDSGEDFGSYFFDIENAASQVKWDFPNYEGSYEDLEKYLNRFSNIEVVFTGDYNRDLKLFLNAIKEVSAILLGNPALVEAMKE